MTSRSPDVDLDRLFAQRDHVLLSFSGGKESVVNAHLVERWRDWVTLVWLNTGDHPAGKVEFVRSYASRFNLVEVTSDPRASWAIHGPPAEVVPVDAAMSAMPGPKLQPWSMCCWRNRQIPLQRRAQELASRLVDNGFATAMIDGQREADHAYSQSDAGRDFPFPELIWPLWSWSEDDVMAYIADYGLQLAPHYAEHCDSIECLSCPADMSRSRMSYLDRHHPDIARDARRMMRRAVGVAGDALAKVSDCLSAPNCSSDSGAAANEMRA